SQSRAEQSKLSAPECGTGPVGATSPGEFESSSSSGEESSGLQHQGRRVRVFNISCFSGAREVRQ
ncbi:MAG: hypothetical protein ACK53Y_25885, partial [bacterium]